MKFKSLTRGGKERRRLGERELFYPNNNNNDSINYVMRFRPCAESGILSVCTRMCLPLIFIWMKKLHLDEWQEWCTCACTQAKWMRKLEVAVATKPVAVDIGKSNLFLVTCWKQKIIICNEAVGVCWIWGSTEDQILIKKTQTLFECHRQRADEN